jgi:hypothetical protein
MIGSSTNKTEEDDVCINRRERENARDDEIVTKMWTRKSEIERN